VRLVIDDRGIFDRKLKVGVIEWHDIRGAYVDRVAGNAFICLELRDSAKYTSRLSPVRRLIARLNKTFGYTEFSLNLAGTAVDPDRLRQLILDGVAARSR